MAKKKEVHESEEQTIAEVVTPTLETVINSETGETINDFFEKDIVKEEKQEEENIVLPIEVKKEKVKETIKEVITSYNEEITIDPIITTAKNIVDDITLKTEFEVGDSVKIDDKPYKVVKVKVTKSYDLEDQFGRVERNVYGHLVKDNSVNFASFVAKTNELQ
jgi:hypothetical protein